MFCRASAGGGSRAGARTRTASCAGATIAAGAVSTAESRKRPARITQRVLKRGAGMLGIAAMRPRDVRSIRDAAERERRLTIDPRHEEPPHGDGPWPPYWGEDDLPLPKNEMLRAAVTAIVIIAVMVAIFLAVHFFFEIYFPEAA